MWRIAASVAGDTAIRLNTTLAGAGGVTCAGVAAGLEAVNARRVGRTDSRSHFGAIEVPARGAGCGAGGTEADDQGGGEEGEFRFHGWIWFAWF